MFFSLAKLIASTCCNHQWHYTKISRTQEVRRCKACDKLQELDLLKRKGFHTCSEGEYFKALTRSRNYKNFAA